MRAWTVLCVAASSALIASPTFAQMPQTRLYGIFPNGGQADSEVTVTLSDGADLQGVDQLQFTHPEIKAEVAPEPEGKDKKKNNKGPQRFLVKIGQGVAPGIYEVRAAGTFGISNPRRFQVGTRPELLEKEANNEPSNAMPVELGSLVNGQVDGKADIDWYSFEGQSGQTVIVDLAAERIDSKLVGALSLTDESGNRLAQTFNAGQGDPQLVVQLPEDGKYFVKVYDFVYDGSRQHFYRLSLHADAEIAFLWPPAGQAGQKSKFTAYGWNLPGGAPSDMGDDQGLQQREVEIELPAEAGLESGYGWPTGAAGLDGIVWRLDGPAGPSNPVPVYAASAPVRIEQEPNDTPEQAQQVQLPAETAGRFQSVGDVDWFRFDAKAGQVLFLEVISQRMGVPTDPYFIMEQVTEKDGKETVKKITDQDDQAAAAANNTTQTATYSSDTVDPGYRFKVPADGTYRVCVKDRFAESRGDARLTYRLAIREAAPDFRLIVLPNSGSQDKNKGPDTGAIVLRKGETVLVPIHVVRRDGFDGAIRIEAESLPSGLTAAPAIVGPGENDAQLLITAASNAKAEVGELAFVGTATVFDAAAVAEYDAAEKALPNAEKAAKSAKGDAKAKAEEQLKAARDRLDKARQQRNTSAKEIRRPAREATIVWAGDNNRMPVIRLSQSAMACLLDEEAPFQLQSETQDKTVAQGEEFEVPLKLQKAGKFNETVKLSSSGLPKDANILVEVDKEIAKGKDSAVAKINVTDKTKPGTYTLRINGQGQFEYQPPADPQADEKNKPKPKKINFTSATTLLLTVQPAEPKNKK